MQEKWLLSFVPSIYTVKCSSTKHFLLEILGLQCRKLFLGFILIHFQIISFYNVHYFIRTIYCPDDGVLSIMFSLNLVTVNIGIAKLELISLVSSILILVL